MANMYAKYPEKKAHPHAEVIKAWADGNIVQRKMRVNDLEDWVDVSFDFMPEFLAAVEYRIKPAEPERVYPKESRSLNDLEARYKVYAVFSAGQGLYNFANDVLCHACDAGQVVTREEFDRMCADRKARDMAVAKAVQEAIIASFRAYRVNDAPHLVGWRPVDLEAIISEVKP